MRRPTHRAAAALGALALALTTLMATATPATTAPDPPPPAGATTEPGPPWRWKTVIAEKLLEENDTVAVVATCPPGYLPLTGNWSAKYRVGENELGPIYKKFRALDLVESFSDFPARYYKVEVRNAGGRKAVVTVWAECAHVDDLLDFVTVGKWFERDRKGRAGGVVSCPEGFGAIGAGHEWSAAARARRIDQSVSMPLGTGWYASGYSDQNKDRLWIEVHCLPDALLTGEQYAFRQEKVTGPAVVNQTVHCPPGTRILTMGASARPAGRQRRPSVDTGRIVALDKWSTSISPAVFTAVMSRIPTGKVVVRAEARCIPVAKPTLLFDPAPPSGTTSSRDVHYTFYAQDSGGEELVFRCWFDGRRLYRASCTPGTPYTLTGLSDGTHTLRFEAENTSHQVFEQSFTWTVQGAP